MNVFKDGVLVDVNVSYWSGAKVLNPEDLGLDKINVAESYKLGRKFLVPAKVLQRFRTIENRARHLVERNSFSFPIGNARFVPKNKFPKVLAELQKYQKIYEDQTNDLIVNYETYRQEMVPIYQQAAETAWMTQQPIGVQEFSIEDREAERHRFIQEFMARINSYYPDPRTLRARYSLDWDVYEVAMPAMRLSDSVKIARREEANEELHQQMQKKIGTFVDDVVSSLRKETTEVCTRVIRNIKEGKVIRSNTLSSLKEFIDRFRELNFVGDLRIETELLNLRKEFLSVHTSDTLKDNADLREELGRRLTMISEAASDITDINSVTGEYKRQIQWQDDDVAQAA
jgi:hypothetical protein